MSEIKLKDLSIRDTVTGVLSSRDMDLHPNADLAIDDLTDFFNEVLQDLVKEVESKNDKNKLHGIVSSLIFEVPVKVTKRKWWRL